MKIPSSLRFSNNFPDIIDLFLICFLMFTVIPLARFPQLAPSSLNSTEKFNLSHPCYHESPSRERPDGGRQTALCGQVTKVWNLQPIACHRKFWSMFAREVSVSPNDTKTGKGRVLLWIVYNDPAMSTARTKWLGTHFRRGTGVRWIPNVVSVFEERFCEKGSSLILIGFLGQLLAASVDRVLGTGGLCAMDVGYGIGTLKCLKSWILNNREVKVMLWIEWYLIQVLIIVFAHINFPSNSLCLIDSIAILSNTIQ